MIMPESCSTCFRDDPPDDTVSTVIVAVDTVFNLVGARGGQQVSDVCRGVRQRATW